MTTPFSSAARKAMASAALKSAQTQSFRMMANGQPFAAVLSVPRIVSDFFESDHAGRSPDLRFKRVPFAFPSLWGQWHVNGP
jgi:hypothetical protein